jgi:SNF2 family DNA or RNA helicase
MNYEDFIDQKRHKPSNYGIEPSWMPSGLFDYQTYVTEYAIRKGRCAVFLDTGLGKTIIELTVAQNYVKHTGKPVLILTPLAVAFQFIREAEKFGITDIQYSKDGKYDAHIVVCNYERLDKFNADDFGCVILDESSILKNFDGAIKANVTQFMRRVPYRYLFTATPSPNDFVELGTSAEALGYMGYMDMLGKFFANNDNNIRPHDIGTKFYIKPHAYNAFFEWVSGWSISMRKPSDHGFSDDRHVLPEKTVNLHAVRNDENWIIDGQVLMFNIVAKSMSEVRQEQKMTQQARCEKAVSLVDGHDRTVYWCNFNQEGDLLAKMDPTAKQISGSMDIDEKEELLLGFANGEINRLITKPKITAFGLNWQHCSHTVYFPTFSYEQYYQAIRRFWRFGQTRPVTVDIVHSDGQKRVIDGLFSKSAKMDELFSRLNNTLNTYHEDSRPQFEKPVTLPSFLS